MRTCSSCARCLPTARFNRRGTGRQRVCKDCHRDLIRASRERRPDKAAATRRRNHLAKYGLTPADYDELLDVQGGRCALCPRRPEDTDRANLCVDHDAGTGEVRGLLCPECNKGLGFLRHAPELLRSAAAYLEAPPARAALQRANAA